MTKISYASPLIAICPYCTVAVGEFCDSSHPCEANSHESRWRAAQGVEIARLRTENEALLAVARAAFKSVESTRHSERAFFHGNTCHECFGRGFIDTSKSSGQEGTTRTCPTCLEQRLANAEAERDGYAKHIDNHDCEVEKLMADAAALREAIVEWAGHDPRCQEKECTARKALASGAGETLLKELNEARASQVWADRLCELLGYPNDDLPSADAIANQLKAAEEVCESLEADQPNTTWTTAIQKWRALKNPQVKP